MQNTSQITIVGAILKTPNGAMLECTMCGTMYCPREVLQLPQPPQPRVRNILEFVPGLAPEVKVLQEGELRQGLEPCVRHPVAPVQAQLHQACQSQECPLC